MLVIVLTHITELRLHSGDQRVNVYRHVLDGLDVVTVLGGDLSLKLLDEIFFVSDNLGTGSFLGLNVLFKSSKPIDQIIFIS